MGHEFIGIVEAVGSACRHVKAGDLVVSPFLGPTAPVCSASEASTSSCLHGGSYGWADVDGGQGEAVCVPQADGTLVVLPVAKTTLDAFAPRAYRRDGNRSSRRCWPRKSAREDGCSRRGRRCRTLRRDRSQASRRGPDHPSRQRPERITLGQEFGATDIVTERGDEAVERVRELTEDWCGLGARVRRSGRSCGHRPRARGPGRRGRPCWRSRERDAPRRRAVLEERQCLRWADFGPRIHRGAARGRPRGKDRAGARLRPRDRPRRSAGRLPRDERARVDQGHGRA